MKRTGMSGGFALRYGMGFLGLLMLWLGFSEWVVPRIIVSAYHGRSLRVLNNLITGQATVGVDAYFSAWDSLSRSITVVIAAAGILLFLGLLFRVPIRRTAGELKASLTHVPIEWRRGLLIAAWLGAVAGALEGISVHLRWAIMNFPGREYSRHVLWTAPLTTALLFSLGAVILFVAFKRRGVIGQGIIVLSLTFLGSYSLLRVVKLGLHHYAVLLLALGIAVQLTRVTTARPAGFSHLVARSARWLAAMVVIVAAGMLAWGRLGSWYALRTLPASAGGAPNILLIILDTVRASSLSLYGYERPTSPELERFAQRGTTFDMAIAPSSWTLPSHATVFTGRYHHEVSADWMIPLDDRFPTLAEILAAHGYETAGFVANYFYASRETGLVRGFIRYDDRPVSMGSLINDTWLTRRLALEVRTRLGTHQPLVTRTAESINARVFDWLAGRENRPFFAFINYFDAHDPYRPPPPFSARFGSPDGRYWTAWNAKYSTRERQQLVDAYDNAIAYVDAQVGALLDTLRTRQLLDNTIVLVTSDHGEQFGERHPRLFNHGNSLYLPLLRVPFVLGYPHHVPGGLRSEVPITLRDVPATIMDLALPHDRSPFPGLSLARYWEDSASVEPGQGAALAELTVNVGWSRARAWARDFEPVHRGPMKSLLVGRLHYIRNGDGGEELYDVVSDPWEERDLSHVEPRRLELVSLRACLTRMLDHVPASPAADEQRPIPCSRPPDASPAAHGGGQP